jgi:hypothetical protein
MRLQAFDGQKWISVLERIPRDLIEFEFRNGHPVYGNDVQDIRFPPVTTDRLRLEIVEEEPKRDWTIGEIKVFETK